MAFLGTCVCGASLVPRAVELFFEELSLEESEAFGRLLAFIGIWPCGPGGRELVGLPLVMGLWSSTILCNYSSTVLIKAVDVLHLSSMTLKPVSLRHYCLGVTCYIKDSFMQHIHLYWWGQASLYNVLFTCLLFSLSSNDIRSFISPGNFKLTASHKICIIC